MTRSSQTKLLRARMSMKIFAGIAGASLAVFPTLTAMAQTGGVTGVTGVGDAQTSTTNAPGTMTPATTTGIGAANGSAINGSSASTGMMGTATPDTANNPGAINGVTTTTPNTNSGSMTTMAPGAITTPDAMNGTSTTSGNIMNITPMSTLSNGGSANGMAVNGTGQSGANTVGPDNIPVIILTPQTDGSINYLALSDEQLNPFELRRAKAYGLSVDDISRAYYISRITYVPFGTILNKVEDGWTFASIAQCYGAPLNVAYSPDRYRRHIDDYMAAWDGTGLHGWRKYHAGEDWPQRMNGMKSMSSGSEMYPSGDNPSH